MRERRDDIARTAFLMSLVAYLMGVATATIFFSMHPGLFL